ncbi:MAG TPA: DEAD/DEAH box helicase [Ktedonobacterales bacterium]
MTADTLAPSMALPSEPTLPAQADTTSAPITSFADLGVDSRVVATLARLGIDTPTLIQARAIPPLLAGRDVVGQSRTGSGKTIAYGLPLVERMDPRLRRLQALVLVPTRELAGQVASVLMTLGAGRGLRVAQLIGGRSYTPQREALRMGAQIAVGAPGRVLDHLRQGVLDLSHLTFAVLDEADQMLDAGFAPDVERLLSAMPEIRQLALFTATLPEMTTQIAKRYLREPISVDAGTPESRPAPTVTQIAYTVPREHRLNALMTLLDRRRDASGTTLVFGRTKHGVDKLARQLNARGYPVAALHGNMSQNARDRVLADFRSGKSPMLLATNVAARGLDVLSIEQVINYELPESAELFTHRVGRTGRMDNTGEAITLLTPDDMAAWRRFQRDLAMKVKPQPWSLGDLSAPAPASTPAPAAESRAESMPSAAEAPLPAAATVAPERAERIERIDRGDFERREERRGERRPAGRPRPVARFGERHDRMDRRPARPDRFDRRSDWRGGRDESRFERDVERDVERDDARSTRREDVVARWTRSARELERRDDFRESRESRDDRQARPARGYERDDDRGYQRSSDRNREPSREQSASRSDERLQGRFTRGADDRRSVGRDDDRQDDRRERRFSGERELRRDSRRSDERPAPRDAREFRRGPARDEAPRGARPRRVSGGFHSTANASRGAGRPTGSRSNGGRAGRQFGQSRSYRPSRG